MLGGVFPCNRPIVKVQKLFRIRVYGLAAVSRCCTMANMASNKTQTQGREGMANDLISEDFGHRRLRSRYQQQKQLAGARMLVIGLIAAALVIEDLESAHSDPSVILQAIENLKGTGNEKAASN